MSEALSTSLSQINFVLSKSMNVWLHYASYSCQCLTIFSLLLNAVRFTFSLLLNRLFCAVCFFCTMMSRLVCVTSVLSLTADWNEATSCWSKAIPEKCLNKRQSLPERIPQRENFQQNSFSLKCICFNKHKVLNRNMFLVRGVLRSVTAFQPGGATLRSLAGVSRRSTFAVQSPTQEQIPLAGCHRWDALWIYQ